MKTTLKLGLLAVLHFLFLTNLNAQDDKIVTFGARVGANLSHFTAKLDKTNLSSLNSRPGFMVGATVDLAFTEEYYLLTGVDFSMKNVIEHRKSDKLKVNAMYTTVPLHFGYKYKSYDTPTFLVRFGPYIGFGIGGDIKNETTNEKVDTFQKEGYKKFDYGLGAALGIELPIEEKGALVIELGYNYGIADISEMKEKLHAREFVVTIGYKF